MGFAFDIIACAALGLVLWAACAGIGSRILPRRRLIRASTATEADLEPQPASWHQPGVAACIGLGTLMMLGGIAVALRLPWWLVTVPFLVTGLGLAIRDAVRSDRRAVPRSALIIGGLAIASLGLVAVIEALVGFRFPLHPWDDLRAYLPMAHRLIDTNGLDDAWNARRLQNVGGFTFLQAVPVAIFGHTGLGIIETMLATIFLGGLFVANGMRTTWARTVSVVLILTIPLLWVPRINTTGVLFGTPLLVALLASTVELRVALRGKHRSAALRWAIGSGLVIAALTSMRPNLGLLAAALLTAGALTAAGVRVVARIEPIAAAGVSALVALAPWSIASWRDVNTPFFLLKPGNQVQDAVQLPQARGAVDLAEQVFELLRAGPYPLMVLGLLIVTVAARKLLPDGPFVAVAAVVTGLVILAIAIQGYTMGRIAFVRYVSPMSQGLAVFVVCELLRSADARRGAGYTRGWLVPVVSAVAVSIAAIGFSGLGLSLEYDTAPGGAALAVRAVRNDLRPPPGLDVTTPSLRASYRRALRVIDPDRTIAAVDRPYLIDYRRYDIPNMDLPGFTAPGGDFPFFTGPSAKITRLRRAGYETLLATVPSTDVALNPFWLRQTQAAGRKAYSPPARYYLDWEEDVETIMKMAPDAVRRFGNVLVIDLRRAEQDLVAAIGAEPSAAP